MGLCSGVAKCFCSLEVVRAYLYDFSNTIHDYAYKGICTASISLIRLAWQMAGQIASA